MSAWLQFLIVGLAAHRITRLITTDTFPFSTIRTYLQKRWAGTIYEEALTCSACMGAWISFALVGSLAQITSIPLPGFYALAASSLVTLVSRYSED